MIVSASEQGSEDDKDGGLERSRPWIEVMTSDEADRQSSVGEPLSSSKLFKGDEELLALGPLLMLLSFCCCCGGLLLLLLLLGLVKLLVFRALLSVVGGAFLKLFPIMLLVLLLLPVLKTTLLKLMLFVDGAKLLPQLPMPVVLMLLLMALIMLLLLVLSGPILPPNKEPLLEKLSNRRLLSVMIAGCCPVLSKSDEHMR